MRRILFLTALILSVPALPVAAKQDTGDPNAAVRKLTAGDPALAEFEKVKRINNELAIKHFTEVIAQQPKNAEAYLKRGKAYAGNKDYDKALADYDQAIGLDPKVADAYVNRAVARFFKNDYDKSWEDVHKAQSLGGEFWPAFLEALKERSGRDK